MSFSVRLGSELMVVDAGSSTPLSVEITSHGQESDTFEITIEGLDPDWVTLPAEPTVISAGSKQTEVIVLRAHRVAESVAGAYTFSVRVRSLSSGETRSAQALLEIQPFHQISLDVEPRKQALGGGAATSQFVLKILNLSNVEHELQLFGSEPDSKVSFQFEHDKVVVGPGQEREILVDVRPNKRSFIASPRLFGLSMSFRSVRFPTVTGYVQAQLEQRPVIAPTTAAFLAFLVLAGGAWYAARPRKPSIEFFRLSVEETRVGEPVEFTWRVQNARSITIQSSDSQEKNTISEAGEGSFRFLKPGNYTITLQALNGQELTKVSEVVKVLPEQLAPQPEILTFEATPTKVNEGDPIKVTFSLNEHVTRLRLAPGVGDLEPSTDSITFVPNWIGPAELSLIAENAKGDQVKKTVRVTVTEISRAQITSFWVSSAEVPAEDPRVSITWRMLNAARAELIVDGKTTPVSPSEGSYELEISQSTKIRLVAYDVKGRKTEQVKSVKLLDPSVSPAPEEEPPTRSDTSPVGDAPPPTNP